MTNISTNTVKIILDVQIIQNEQTLSELNNKLNIAQFQELFLEQSICNIEHNININKYLIEILEHQLSTEIVYNNDNRISIYANIDNVFCNIRAMIELLETVQTCSSIDTNRTNSTTQLSRILEKYMEIFDKIQRKIVQLDNEIMKISLSNSSYLQNK
ncbi:hypothetical protein CBL_00661 [Carabus blaptoides fortunei]